MRVGSALLVRDRYRPVLREWSAYANVVNKLYYHITQPDVYDKASQSELELWQLSARKG
jgi:hypothetical protein